MHNNKNFIAIEYQKDKKDKNKCWISVKINTKEKNNKINNNDSFEIYNYSTLTLDKNKNCLKEKKNSNKTKNNISSLKKNCFEQKIIIIIK